MLSSISPFGERARGSRWWLTVTAYLLASAAGGATTGLLFGGAGQLLAMVLTPKAALALLAAAALAGTAADLGVMGLRLPSIQRQVNEDWLTTYRGWVYGAGFGYQLGLGLATIVTTSTVWLLWIAAAMSGSWVTGLLLGSVFGVVRGSLILGNAWVSEPADLRRLFTTISAHAAKVHQLAVATAALTALAALAGLAA